MAEEEKWDLPPNERTQLGEPDDVDGRWPWVLRAIRAGAELVADAEQAMKFLVRVVIAVVVIAWLAASLPGILASILGILGILGAILKALPIILGLLIAAYVLGALLGKATKCSGPRGKRKRAGKTKRSGYRHHIHDLIREQNEKCAICGRRLPSHRHDLGLVHVDHIRPLHLGGTHAKRNLRAVHAKCNLSRTKKDYEQHRWKPK
ncbi:MAG: HNH endonuclease [Caldilineaceae bacterium]|nr:HNH endonuclease [Caldilineaceae bacterium]